MIARSTRTPLGNYGARDVSLNQAGAAPLLERQAPTSRKGRVEVLKKKWNGLHNARWSRGGLLQIRLLVVGLVAAMTCGVLVMGSSTGAVADAGARGHESLATDRGFTGWVLASGRQLGVATLANGIRGVCFDAGSRPWPDRVITARNVKDPQVAYLLTSWMGRARTDPTVAAALWTVVGLDLGQNSNRKYMRRSLGAFHKEFPAQAKTMERIRSRMRADTARLAPSRGGYKTSGLEVTPGKTTESGTVGKVSGIGAVSARGHYVPGKRVTLKLSGARWARNNKTKIVITSAARARTLSWKHAKPGVVSVRERITGLAPTSFKLQPAMGSAQRVGYGARPVAAKGSAKARVREIFSPTLSTQISHQESTPGTQLVDHVTVKNTGGHRVTGHWRLTGPVQPNSAGDCTGLDWAHAPVAAQGAFTAPGDGTYTVGAHTVTSVGCYTYTENLAESSSTHAAPWTPAGEVSETTLSIGHPSLHTKVNHQKATVGAVLVDNVYINDSYGAQTTGAWQLAGPIKANSSGTCTGLGWSGAPIAAQGAFRIRGDGTYVVGRHKVVEAGCYSYRENLTATTTTTAVPWTAFGITAETTAVSPKQPSIPKHPSITSGFNGVLAGGLGALGRRAPSTVSINSVRLHAPIVGVAFRGSSLTPPPDVQQAGIWTAGAELNSVAGTSVVVGHVSDAHDRPGAFKRLNNTKVGQQVTTRSAGQTQVWKITKIRVTPRDRLPRGIFEQTLKRRLVLVTCTNVVRNNGRFHYRSNQIVEAIQIR